MKVFKLQPAPVIDNITDDGHAFTQLPYPFYVEESGKVRRQDFWRGQVALVVGFQKDLARQRIDLWWEDAVKDLVQAVGMYLVTASSTGGYGVHPTAMSTVELLGEDFPEE